MVPAPVQEAPPGFLMVEVVHYLGQDDRRALPQAIDR
jgi:hypothetical protein